MYQLVLPVPHLSHDTLFVSLKLFEITMRFVLTETSENFVKNKMFRIRGFI